MKAGEKATRKYMKSKWKATQPDATYLQYTWAPKALVLRGVHELPRPAATAGQIQAAALSARVLPVCQHRSVFLCIHVVFPLGDEPISAT